LANLEHRVTDKFFSEVDLISLFDKIMLHEVRTGRIISK
jgi:hypothetical protein